MDIASGTGLCEDVAQDGGFCWSGEHVHLTGGGGELVKKVVLRPAADDMESLDVKTAERFEFFEYGGVFEGERFEATANELPRRFGNWLFGFVAVADDGGRHVFGGEKALIIGIDEAAERFGISGLIDEFGVGMIFPEMIEMFFAVLNEPESHDIFEESIGAIDTAFVGDVEFESLWGIDGFIDFETDQRPGAGTNVGPVFFTG